MRFTDARVFLSHPYSISHSFFKISWRSPYQNGIKITFLSATFSSLKTDISTKEPNLKSKRDAKVSCKYYNRWSESQKSELKRCKCRRFSFSQTIQSRSRVHSRNYFTLLQDIYKDYVLEDATNYSKYYVYLRCV